ncbi:hypothetical protein [uncultured Clostridium sp.]|uniref:hypothetical protein n=1 Tax=uncultured Clostridium sp. TaxID=59620 RepID=UPI0025EB4F7F|nr:hypothetical protein [uncultured Clostridium sp.]
MGARCNDGIINLVKESGGNVVFNISCRGDERDFEIKGDNLLNEYTGQLLHKLIIQNSAKGRLRRELKHLLNQLIQ